MPLSVASSPAANPGAGRIAGAQHVFDAPRALALWHLASLDAPTVAVVWTMAFAWAERVRLPWWASLAVALVTWSAYVADRLLDAWTGLRDIERHGLRERHFFHWRHRRALLPLAIVAASAAAGIILAFMPLMARARDSVLGVAALAYFSGVHSTRRPFPAPWLRSFPGKEFLVGVLFTAGCALAAWSRSHDFTAWTFSIPAAGFAAVAWLNCIFIARWETASSSLDFEVRSVSRGGQPRQFESCPAAAPPDRLVFLPLALAAAQLLLSLFAAAAHPRSAALLAAGAAGALLLALLDCARARITPLALRSAADLALLTPAPLLVLAWAFR